SRRRHTRFSRDWSSDVCSSDLIVEFSDDAILTKNLDGIITSWNRGAERLFGYTAQETMGRSVTMLIPAERTDEEPGILARLRREIGRASCRERVEVGDGVVRLT